MSQRKKENKPNKTSRGPVHANTSVSVQDTPSKPARNQPSVARAPASMTTNGAVPSAADGARNKSEMLLAILLAGQPNSGNSDPVELLCEKSGPSKHMSHYQNHSGPGKAQVVPMAIEKVTASGQTANSIDEGRILLQVLRGATQPTKDQLTTTPVNDQMSPPPTNDQMSPPPTNNQMAPQGPPSGSGSRARFKSRHLLIDYHLNTRKLGREGSADTHSNTMDVANQHNVSPIRDIQSQDKSTAGRPGLSTPGIVSQKQAASSIQADRNSTRTTTPQRHSAIPSHPQRETTDKEGTKTRLVKNIERLARELSSESSKTAQLPIIPPPSQPVLSSESGKKVQLPITPPPSPPVVAHQIPEPTLTEDQAPRDISTSTYPPESWDLPILDSTNVRYRDGLAVEMVTAPFEPTRIVISGISANVERHELDWYLLPFGRVTYSKLKQEDSEPMSKTARVEFAHHQEAENAIHGLDGRLGLATDTPLVAEYDTDIAPNLTRVNIVTDTIIIRWEIPTPKLRLYYRNPRVAREEVDVIKRRLFHGRRLQATLWDSQHVIIVEGLERKSDLQEIIRRHSPDKDPEFLEDYYDHSQAMEQIRSLFQGTNLRNFDVQEREKGVVIYLNFLSQSDAQGVLKSFRSLDLPWRAAARLCVIHAWKLVYVIQSEKIVALQASIDDLAAKLRQVDIRLRIFVPTGHSNFRHVQVSGGNHIKSYKPMIDSILVGHAVSRKGKPLWDADLVRISGPSLFSKLGLEDIHVYADSRRQRIMLSCSNDRREAATQRIYRVFDQAKQRLHSHTFQRWQLRYFLEAYWNTIVPRLGAQAVFIDTRTCKITASGTLARNHLNQIVSEAPQINPRGQAPKPTGAQCPVCLDMPSRPVSLLCQHQFCELCLTQYLLSSSQPGATFPIRCFGDEGRCTLNIPLNIIRRLLTHDQLDLAASRSLKSYVDSRPKEYRYCPTNDCPQIFRIRPQTDTLESAEQCPSCLNKFCMSCFLEGHNGITCAKALENQRFAMEDEAPVVEEWFRNMGGRKCPKCKMGLVKDGGCAHVQCSKCKVHICWTCGKTFEQVADESVYEHMQREHGTIGLTNWEADGRNANDMAGWIESPIAPTQSSGSSNGNTVAVKSSMAARRTNGRRERRNKPPRIRSQRGLRVREYDDDGLSEDQHDDFGGGQWDFDFADVNWESF